MQTFASSDEEETTSKCVQYTFWRKGVEFINTACFLRDPDIVESLPSSSVKFPMPMVIYKLTPPPCTKCFNFNNFVNELDLDLFLTNQDSLSCNCKNSPFTERHHKHIVTVDLWIIRNYALRKLFVKGPKYKEVRSIKSERAKYCILEGLDNCFLSWCCKNSVEKYFFLEWTNYVKIKINERRAIYKIVYIKINIEIGYHLLILKTPHIIHIRIL